MPTVSSQGKVLLNIPPNTPKTRSALRVTTGSLLGGSSLTNKINPLV
jgi:hypothetical protein